MAMLLCVSTMVRISHKYSYLEEEIKITVPSVMGGSWMSSLGGGGR